MKMLIVLLMVLLLTLTVVTAKQDFSDTELPKNAVKLKHGVFKLGNAVDIDGKIVEGYAFIKYEDGYKQKNADFFAITNLTPEYCYGFMGAKWTTTENYIINPTNKWGLDKTQVSSHFVGDTSTWETSVVSNKNLIGTGATTSKKLLADTVRPDGKNEVYFGSIKDAGAIAITIVWATRFDVNNLGQIVEWDQVYDQIDFGWSLTGAAGKMDFDNIATHELGHTLGMDDLYDLVCSDQTMYGYANYGEIIKRTLEVGDIKGINILYP
ncbi:MAG: matrixin family metalloprotease [Candidatus Woesearchaeota archaeon]